LNEKTDNGLDMDDCMIYQNKKKMKTTKRDTDESRDEQKKKKKNNQKQKKGVAQKHATNVNQHLSKTQACIISRHKGAQLRDKKNKKSRRKEEGDTTRPVIPTAPFARVLKGVCGDSFRVSGEAKEALREATEAYLTELFFKSDLVRAHSGRKTMIPTDMALVARLGLPFDYVVGRCG